MIDCGESDSMIEISGKFYFRNSDKSYIFNIMYKEDLALNNLQWLICHKTQPNQIIYI